MHLAGRGLMADVGRHAFEKAYSYKIVPKGKALL